MSAGLYTAHTCSVQQTADLFHQSNPFLISFASGKTHLSRQQTNLENFKYQQTQTHVMLHQMWYKGQDKK